MQGLECGRLNQNKISIWLEALHIISLIKNQASEIDRKLEYYWVVFL